MMNHRLSASAWVAASAIALLSTAAAAEPLRTELLAGRDDGRWTEPNRHTHRHPGHSTERHRDRYRGYRHAESRRYHEDRAVGRARRYAARAVDQARQARRLGFHPSHPRWSLNYERHFRWALRADRRDAEREVRRRAHQLRKWRRYGYGPRNGYESGYGYGHKPY
jgi:hypothetical protein